MIDITQLSDSTIMHYSLKEHGEDLFKDSQLTHFKVKEFACKDGSDEVVICVKLVRLLEKIRVITGQPVYISSAYRTAEHNRKIGGSKASQHLLGKAADIVVGSLHNNIANSVKIAILADAIGFNGIGTYSTFTHVDVRDTKSHFDFSGQNTIWKNEFCYKL